MHVKKGDRVLVISGNDKGKQGQVQQALPGQGRVIVEGINLRWRHNKPTQQNPKGERIQRESSIHASNVMHVDPKTGKGVRHRTAKAEKPVKAAKAARTETTATTKPAKAATAKPAKTKTAKAGKTKTAKAGKTKTAKAGKTKSAKAGKTKSAKAGKK